jgi:hypothetical protein
VAQVAHKRHTRNSSSHSKPESLREFTFSSGSILTSESGSISASAEVEVSQASRILKAKSDQETLDRALDLVIAERPIVRTHRRLRRTGGFIDVFES